MNASCPHNITLVLSSDGCAQDYAVQTAMPDSDDEWETDPDFQNDLTDAQRRAFGNKETSAHVALL